MSKKIDTPFYKSWYVKGDRCVSDLFVENKNYLDFEMLKHKISYSMNYLTFMIAPMRKWSLCHF